MFQATNAAVGVCVDLKTGEDVWNERLSPGKFIAAPFHASDGAAWPAGKNIAFSHWGGPTDTSTEEKFASSQSGHRQFCTSVSGEALSKFIEQYPASDSPEPQGG